MTTLKRLLNQKQQLTDQLAELDQQIKDARGRQLIPCRCCNKKHAISKLHLLVDHYYVEPYSCSGGDYWRTGSKYFVCPNTNIAHRFVFKQHRDYTKREVFAYDEEAQFFRYYENCFGSSEDTYGVKRKTVCSDYISQNSDKFGIVLHDPTNYWPAS